MCCSDCGSDYSFLGKGLVKPRWIAFTQCTASEHRFNCTCTDFLQSRVDSQHREPPSKHELDSVQHLSDEENETFHDAESDWVINDQGNGSEDNAWIVECIKLIQQRESGRKNDPFWDVAVLLYRAQARVWLGRYEPGELVCCTCFLRREGYVDDEVNDDHDIFGSMPSVFAS